MQITNIVTIIIVSVALGATYMSSEYSNSLPEKYMIAHSKDLPDDPTERIQALYEIALQVWDGNVKMAKIAVGQAILESSLLKKDISGLALKNNLFGIKGSGTAGKSSMKTMEQIKGRWVSVQDGFAVNSTLRDSFIQHMTLLTTKERYRDVLSAPDVKSATIALGKSGYATDLKYGTKVLSVILKYIG